ncbi:phage head-tail joining protein [Ancylobacter sp.]|uniref:phage head-tail joining protein n=1 Tax=Ancylobacter sp. TaxID=1872567 RepID=UPI003D0D6F60
MAVRDSLEDRLAKLRSARAEGIRRLRYSDGREVEYRTDSELAAAIADVERQIAGANAPAKVVYLATSKGL